MTFWSFASSPTPASIDLQKYAQARDWGKVLNFIGADDVECLKTKEWTPLERGAIEHKYYCPDNGLLQIEGVSGGPKAWTELVDRSEAEASGSMP